METKTEETVSLNPDRKKVQGQQVYPVGEDGWEQVNEQYLDMFEADLKAAGRSKRTIRKNMEYADVYINYFLMRLTDESQDVSKVVIKDENRGILSEGCRRIGYYISYYYIYKDLDATPYNLEQTLQAIKNFYKSMMNHGCVSRDDYETLCCVIDCDKDMWLEECEKRCVEAYGEEEWRKMCKGETYFI